MNRTRAVLLATLAASVFALASTTYAQIAPAPLPAALSPTKIPQFAQALPVLLKDIPVVDGTQSVQMNMCEYEQSVLPPKTPIVGKPGITLGKTVVWGYQAGTAGCKDTPDAVPGSYIGPVIVAQRNTPTQVTYQNSLGTSSGTKVLAYQQSTDQTLVWADPLGTTSDIAATNQPEQNACANWVKANPGVIPPGNCAKHYDGYVAAAPHLHGGEIPAMLDGGPDAWWTSTGIKGHGYYTRPNTPVTTSQAVYRYPNGQEAAPIWFHDHTLGATRLNVYAGIAGAYMIVDPAATLPDGMTALGLSNGKADANGAATEELLIPVVLQDRMFDVNGQLLFPNLGINPDHPFWIPEFVGDTIVVNGKAWPYHNVEPKRYRFLFLNGSNARTYELFLINKVTGVKGPAMYVIGTDQGYLDAPAKIDPNVKPNNVLVMMPGERYEVVIDFTGFAGTKLLLANSGKTPYPAGAPPAGGTVGRIMEFRVGTCTSFCGGNDPSYNPAVPPNPPTLTPIRMANPIQRLADPLTGMSAAGITIDTVRQLTLNEVIAKGGPVEILVNNTPYLGMNRLDFTEVTTASGTTYYSERPNEGETELWEIVNLTADAHPIHPHLVGFQLVNRQAFDVKGYNAAYAMAFGGVYKPGDGPPADYNTCPVTAPLLPRTNCVGGNPDVGQFLAPALIPPKPSEAGWKDTVMALPGQVTRFLVRFAPADLPATATSADPGAAYAFNPDGGHGYVWHCHIIDHEDNEMMRPFSVVSRTDICDPYLLPADGVCTTAARSFVRGRDY